MTAYRKTGVWMDHCNAHIIPFLDTAYMPQTISSGFTNHDSEKITEGRTSAMLSLEQQQNNVYYKHIAALLCESDEVFLFGPTDAKNELFRMLREDESFDAKRIELYNPDSTPVACEHEPEENFFSGQGA